MTRSISILGATGSVGEQTLDLIRRNPDEWQVEALTANCSAKQLATFAREFSAKIAVVSDESCLPELREALVGTDIEAAGGRAALCEAASRPVDITVAAIVGCAGLAPVMAAIEQGGTTLRDFVGGDGSPGYFAQQLRAYGRDGQPCRVCQGQLKEIRQGGRSTVLCSQCQR